jgi:hypothetical protein
MPAMPGTGGNGIRRAAAELVPNLGPLPVAAVTPPISRASTSATLTA